MITLEEARQKMKADYEYRKSHPEALVCKNPNHAQNGICHPRVDGTDINGRPWRKK